VEFEFGSAKGYWSHRRVGTEQRTLKATLGWLGGLGYTCYMEAGADLAPLSGDCWRDAFGNNGWSNVVCAHRQEALSVLDRIAASGAQRRAGRRGRRAPPPPHDDVGGGTERGAR